MTPREEELRQHIRALLRILDDADKPRPSVDWAARAVIRDAAKEALTR